MRTSRLWIGLSVAAWMLLGALAMGQEPEGSRGLGAAEPEAETTSEGAFSLGRYRALLIGVAKYKNDIRELATPLNDVATLARLLSDRFGFERVDLLRDEEATRERILKELRDLGGDTLGNEDNVLIYFAGHGTRYPEDGPKGYWMPVDAKPGDVGSWIGAEEVQGLIADIKARHVLLVSDSCFAGFFTREEVKLKEPARYTRKVWEAPSYQVIASAGNQPAADLGRNGLSLFAYYFTYVLESMTEDHRTAMEIYRDVAVGVANHAGSAQEPWLAVIPGTFDHRGQFIFARQGAADLASRPAESRAASGLPAGYSLPAYVERRGDFYVRRGADESEMVLVWPGRYLAEGGERPYMDPFLIDRHEVTVERFQHFLREIGEPRDLLYWGEPDYRGASQPVVGITLHHARAFAKWAGKQLPDELQWRYAARWDHETQSFLEHPWGASYEGAGLSRCVFPPAIDPASKDLSPFGAVGMGGGVREWCEIRPFDPARGLVLGASQVLASRRDVLGGDSAYKRIARADDRMNNVGFRCITWLRRY